MELIERGQSLRLAVEYGKTNGKKTLIVELDLLDEIFRGNVPVGGNEKPPEDVNALMYEMKGQRDKLLHACWLALSDMERWQRMDAGHEPLQDSPTMMALREAITRVQSLTR